MITRAIVFPGQGAQAVGMGRDLAESHPRARETLEEADDILGYALSALCFAGPDEELTRTDRAQAAIFVTSVAAVRAFEAEGRLARDAFGATAGLSLGEYTAWWFAGAFSFADGLRLVQRRGTAMQGASEAAPSGMVTLLGADRETAERVCSQARGDGVLVVANLNAPGQVVVSGDRDACGRVPEAAKACGLRRAIPLKVAGAFHSPLMAPAQESLEQALAATEIADPRVPVYSNVTGEPARSADEARALLARQVVSPVLWQASVERLAEDGFRLFVEPPPGRVLAGLMRKIDQTLEVEGLESA